MSVTESLSDAGPALMSIGGGRRPDLAKMQVAPRGRGWKRLIARFKEIWHRLKSGSDKIAKKAFETFLSQNHAKTADTGRVEGAD